MITRAVGVDALLVEVGTTEEAMALYDAARSAALPVTDLVPASRTVLLDGIRDQSTVAGFLAAVDLSSYERPHRAERSVEVPVRYDGADLDEVARCWDMTRPEVVATHTGTGFEVAFCGFVPGFAYCTGLPPQLSVRRRASPRPRVPAGSVGLAGEFTGVYPTASPGGWLLLGRTDLTLWDPAREEPAVLGPGTRVRFVEVAP